VQEGPFLHEVLVVGILEDGRRLQVKRRQVVIAGAGGARAVWLAALREAGIDVGVVVDVAPEVSAAR
jgi:ribosomal protein S11